MLGLILASGRGTRLREETKDKPKCMVEVANKPVLEHIADHMNKHGIWRIVVNLHSFPEVVMKYFGQRFLYLYEPVPTGEWVTFQTISSWFYTDTIVVMNGDTLTDLDFNKYPPGIYLKNGVHMGTSKSSPIRESAQTIDVDCWYQDIGTPEGLMAARKHYER